MLFLFKAFPPVVSRLCAFPVSLCYYLSSPRVRRESRRFFDTLALVSGSPKGEKYSSYKHIAAFALALVEKVEAWGGRIDLDKVHFQGDIPDLIGRLERKEGALLICSHLGNAELLRALADHNRTGVSRGIPVISIVDFSVAEQFNRMLSELNPASANCLVSAKNIGVETVERLQDCIAAGGLVVIAGDRTSANTRSRYCLIPFLGKDAPFALGPFYLAALLKTAVYFVFALRRRSLSVSVEYDMLAYKSPLVFDGPRSERNGRIETLARAFAARLEALCREHPYEWYNFYNFWEKNSEGNEGTV